MAQYQQDALMRQLETSHNAWALYQKLALMRRVGDAVSQETVDDARAFAREVKTDLLRMLGLPA